MFTIFTNIQYYVLFSEPASCLKTIARLLIMHTRTKISDIVQYETATCSHWWQ